jgi:hypothetical protein
MDERPFYSVEIDFAAKDLAEAERIAEKMLDVVCGGEIGLGLHVCQNHDWVMAGPKLIEDDDD